ncbi:MlaD family protein [bacterium]|nr:MlaD family protein [bacterium]
MRRVTTEAKVGIFFVVVFVLIAWISTRLGDYGFNTEYQKKLSAVFDTAAGLSDGANVNLAGIRIGKVDHKELEGARARVVIRVRKDSRIPVDSRVVILAQGFLGQRYVEIVPGRADEIMQEGDEFKYVEETSDVAMLTNDLSDIAQDIKAVTGTMRNVFGTEQGEDDLRDALSALSTITVTLADTLEVNQRNMDRVMENMAAFTADMAYLSQKNREDLSRAMSALPAIAENLRDISGNMSTLLADNREDLNRTLENLGVVTENLGRSLEAVASIAEKIDSGEGTLGKLVNEDSTVENINEAIENLNEYLGRVRTLQVEVAYRGEYHLPQQSLKSYVNLNIRPRFDKIYMLSIVDAPNGRTSYSRTVTETTTNEGLADEDTTRKVEHKAVTTSQLLISAQIAKRWHDVVLRAGILESSGGGGADLFLFGDHLSLSFEAFDFAPGNNAHLKTYANAYFLDHFFITAGVDDFINRYDDPRFFFGAGIYFTDQDITTLATRVPTGAVP